MKKIFLAMAIAFAITTAMTITVGEEANPSARSFSIKFAVVALGQRKRTFGVMVICCGRMLWT
jgi:hypothetical protein